MRETRRIRSLRPSVLEEEAIGAFCGGLSGRAYQLRNGPLRSVSAAYVPFFLYAVDILNRGARETSLFAMDAFNGSLDLYRFESAPAASALAEIETANAVPAALEPGLAAGILRGKVERLLFQTGFFRLRGLRIEVRDAVAEMHVPYWLGFFGRGDFASLRVMDAVRRRMEGAKAQAFFRDWLKHEN